MFKWILNLFKKKESKPVAIKPFKPITPKHYQIAKDELGVTEIPGGTHNPRVIEYHKATSLKASTDEVPWCASFVNWCLKQAGVEGTHSALARSFLVWGLPVFKNPMAGDVVVFWRGDRKASTGHVAFYVREDAEYIYVLGGNQNNQVNISRYPREQLLAYRRLA